MRSLFGAALVMALAVAAPLLASDETGLEAEQQARREEVARKLSDMSRLLTAYDYVTFNMSGPAVVLQGFCTKAVIKKDAEKAVRELDWVTHVVNQIDFIPAEPAGNDIRRETLSILRAACPQAFPENRAYIRIKVDQAHNVTLVGGIDPGDEKRLDAAVLQIKQLPLVKDVDNDVLSKGAE